jgi:hypothetical protein
MVKLAVSKFLAAISVFALVTSFVSTDASFLQLTEKNTIIVAIAMF